MSIVLGQDWTRPEPILEPDPDPAEDLLARVYLAVEALQATFAQIPAPQVNLEPADFTDIVTAVQDLKGPAGPSATEIALAIREVLMPALTPAASEDQTSLRIVEALEKLDFRLKGLGTSWGGAGSLSLPDDPNRQLGTVTLDLGHFLDENNTATLTSANCAPGNPWVGEATNTLDLKVVGIFLSVISSAPIAGTYTFQFGDDGLTWPVTIGLPSTDFTTIRFRELLDVKTYYRAQFEPATPMGSTLVFVSSEMSRTANPRFVVPALHIFEETEAAFPTEFAFLKGFNEDGDSQNIKALRADQDIADTDYGIFTKSIGSGLNPDEMHTDARLGGSRTLSPAPSVLGASGVYTSGWMDCEQYPSVRLLATSDVASADNGLVLQWSDTPTGVVVRTTERHTFRSSFTTDGHLYPTQTRERYLRITYTNGLTPQTRFHLNLRLSPYLVAPSVEVVPSSSGRTGQQDVTLTATALPASLAGRDAVRLKNLSTSARPLFYGFDSALTVLNGDELAVGESIELDMDEQGALYVVTTSTGGAGVRCSYSELA